MQPLVIHSASK